MEFLRATFVHLNVWASAWSALLITILWVGAHERRAALVTVLFLAMVVPLNVTFVIQSMPELYAELALLVDYLPLSLFWIPPAALHVACLWTHHQDCRVSRSLLIGAYVLGTAGFLAQLFGLLQIGPLVDHGWGAMRSGKEARILFGLQGLLLLVCFGVSVYWCLERLREDGAADARKIGARVWLLGATIFAAGAVTNYLVVFGLPAVPVAAVGNVVFLSVLAISIVRRGFLRVDLEIGRVASAVSIAVTSVWIVVSVWFLARSSNVLSAYWVALEVAVATAGAGVILGYAVVRRLTRTQAEAFVAGLLESEEPFRFDVARVRAATGKKELSQLVTDALNGLPALEGLGVYRRSHAGRLYRLDAAIGAQRAFPLAATRTELDAICLPRAWPARNESKPQDVERDEPASSEPKCEAGALRTQGAVAVPVPGLGNEDGYVVVYDSQAFLGWERYALLRWIGFTLAALWYKVGLQNEVERFFESLTSGRRGEQRGNQVASSTAAEGRNVAPSGSARPGETKPRPMPEARRRAAEEPPELRAIVGESPLLLAAIERAKRAAHGNYPVILLGETGTGKELFARAIHALSPRARRPFHATNCAAVPLDLAENEFFGHNRGAYTGATQNHVGWFEKLSGGTLFLDEIGDLPLNLQAKLLRAIELGEVVRLGSTDTKYVDVRIIAATNRPIVQLVREGKFREDLFHRLQGVVIKLPPLRDRLEDLPLLLADFLRRSGVVWNEQRCSEETYELMRQYSWPGNVRELRSTVETSLTPTGEFDEEAFRIAVEEKAMPQWSTTPILGRPFFVNLTRPLSQAVRHYKLAHVQAALQFENGNAAAAARILGMSKSNFNRLLRSLGVDPKRLDFDCE